MSWHLQQHRPWNHRSFQSGHRRWIHKVTVLSEVTKRNCSNFQRKISDTIFYKEKRNRYQCKKPIATQRILSTLRMDLRMDKDPVHIECFDNSISREPIPFHLASYLKNAKPSKNDYRHFNVKTVTGPNDFASMSEVVYRRYKRFAGWKQIITWSDPSLMVAKVNWVLLWESISKLGIWDRVVVIGIGKDLKKSYFEIQFHYTSIKNLNLKLIQTTKWSTPICYQFSPGSTLS